MHPLFVITTLFPLASFAKNYSLHPPTLNPSLPIYLAHISQPASFSFLAYLPPFAPSSASSSSPFHWCKNAVAIQNPYHQIPTHRKKTFELGGIEDLQIHDYFSQEGNAWISYRGRKFADCWVTPESGDIGSCSGKEGESKLKGNGVRMWSCWVDLVGDTRRRDEGGKERVAEWENEHEQTFEEEEEEEDWVVDAMVTGASTIVEEVGAATKARIGSTVLGAFTPGITGR